MNKPLAGKSVVIAGSQKTEEMKLILEKQGAKTIVRSMQGLTFYDEQSLEQGLLMFIEQGVDLLILTTEIGTKALFTVADKLGILASFTDVIRESQIALRGYKTYAFMKQQGLSAVVIDEDGTVQSLMEKLKELPLENQRVAVQLHGEYSPEIELFMVEKKVRSIQYLLPYRHTPPEPHVAEKLVDEILTGQVDAVCLTTRVQVQNLFEYARGVKKEGALKQVFENNVVAVAVGKVTARALQEEGIHRIIVPESERMGAMVIELSKYYSKHH